MKFLADCNLVPHPVVVLFGCSREMLCCAHITYPELCVCVCVWVGGCIFIRAWTSNLELITAQSSQAEGAPSTACCSRLFSPKVIIV